ncbi:DAK2 domain-containing protein [Nocardioides jiangxiensis]|uniref:DAK2 domain-containing protein n=1 Tax=Nocardioides jiangxiensis TaxID=3064524 RepID=A0ABT9B7P8_9ACTN|nr:DAK2 domain-containing protein [Nocardioides sp. WY-20]MDO7869163.1 DAK2 domain-containing protein [Nocardioides sp. WY-20]
MFDITTVARFVELATDALADAREEIDALNVYPVPDGDTGTNMFLTVQAGRDALLESVARGDDAETALKALARGSLMGARGNSGVILSQLLGALVARMRKAGPEERKSVVLAEAFRDGCEASYAAVGTPVEGTILSVMKAAAEAAMAVAPNDSSAPTIAAAAEAARVALERTPQQLKLLADSGVVDAGGRGLVVVFEAAEEALTGRRRVEPTKARGERSVPLVLPTDDLTEDGPAYEVMYLLDADDAVVGDLRAELAGLGDSLVVVGGDGLWNVHIHTDDVGAAIEAGIHVGRPHRVQVTHFAEQVAAAKARRPIGVGRSIVAVTAGPGLQQLFEEAGAITVATEPGLRPSAAEILRAIDASGAAEVVVLPNDPDSLQVAEIAARGAEESGRVKVAVIPSQAQVQGLAAVAVHEPGRPFDQDVVAMTAAARHARHGAVTVAARKAITSAGACSPGDVLGAIDGDFVVVGDDLFDVAYGVLGRLIGGGGAELVTLVAGQDAGDLAERLAKMVARRHPVLDVVVYDGGQARYPLLVAVE